ncbi:MAG: hypothetical protein GF308_13225 [Candidatus Heimdallarchaeota archaeon]|nr:hypothetical protein [Candidatus Heimdallarchaeota archaeon]
MLEEFLMAMKDGRCLYYLTKNHSFDPQLISSYLASLIIYMQIHHSRRPKVICMENGQWIIEQDFMGEYFIALLIHSSSKIDERFAREILREIMNSIAIITGDRVTPINYDKEFIWGFIDHMLREKLQQLTIEKIADFTPGLLKENNFPAQKVTTDKK